MEPANILIYSKIVLRWIKMKWRLEKAREEAGIVDSYLAIYVLH